MTERTTNKEILDALIALVSAVDNLPEKYKGGKALERAKNVIAGSTASDYDRNQKQVTA